MDMDTYEKENKILVEAWKEHWEGDKNHPIYKALAAYGLNSFEAIFVNDGIVNFDLYNNSGLRILFVLKEPNSDNKCDETNTLDIVGNLKKSSCNNIGKNTTWRNIAYWAYGLLEAHKSDGKIAPNFKEIDKDKMVKAINSIAVINLKKAYGGSTADDKEIEKFSEYDSEFIKRQIKLINPQIIVTGNVAELLEKNICVEDKNIVEIMGDQIFPQGEIIKCKKTNLDIFEDEYKDNWLNIWKVDDKQTIPIIRMYHPAYVSLSADKLKDDYKSEGWTEKTRFDACCKAYSMYLTNTYEIEK